MSILLRDLRYALRQLRKSPGFAITAILTLALGIGANAAVFSVLNAVLLRPLPFQASKRLVRVFSVKGGANVGPSPPDGRDFSRQNRTFERLAVYDVWRKNVSTSKAGDMPEQHVVGLTSADFFAVLGIHPVLGRMFTSQESEPGHNRVALITESFWQSHYARSPQILGRTLFINDVPYSIIGVLPDAVPDWLQGARLQIFEPFLSSPTVWAEANRGGRNYKTVGLLKPGVTLQQAQADLGTIARNLAATYPIDHGYGVAVQPLVNSRVGDLEPILLLLMGAVFLILLIACSNLAALILARNSVRQGEFAMRSALGASRAALVRQILIETLLLSFAGGGCGIAIARISEIVLQQRHPGSMPQLADLHLDWRVFVFTFAVALGTNLLFGVVPAMLNTRIQFAGLLKESSRGGSATGARQSFRRLLVIGQIALSLMLMVGAGLLVQTIFHLEDQYLGFRVDHLVKAHFYLPPAQYANPEAITQFCNQYGEKLRASPGVKDASITTIYPPDAQWMMMFSMEGRPVSRLEDLPSASFGVVDDHYLKTAGIPLIAGRDFSDSDNENTPIAAIVNQAFVRRYFSAENPIGRHIELGIPASMGITDVWLGNQHPQATVIGIMGDTKNQGLALPVEPQLITLFPQMPLVNYGFKDVLVRSNVSPDALIGELSRQLHSLDPRLPLAQAQSMTDYIADQTSDRRFTTALLTAFAVLGVILAVIGVYGVISYLVVQRQQEIGIRLALGSPRSDILWLITRQGLILASAGVGFGLAGTMLVSHSLSGLLYGISTLDIFTLFAASMCLVIIVLAASVIPGRRATHIDPIQALRRE